jgi:HK97 family phage major capsid protein
MPDEEAPQGQNSYRTLQEIDGRLRSIKRELTRIDDIQEPSQEDYNWQGTLIKEYDDLDEKATPLRTRMKDLRRIANSAEDPDNREGPESKIPAMRGTTGPDVTVRTKLDPFAEMQRVRDNLVAPSELRARAADLVEVDNKRHRLADDRAELATVRSQNDLRGQIARHMLVTGTPEYRDAFRNYIEFGNIGQELREIEPYMRAINLTSGSGGFLLPYVLDPTIVLSNNASSNPFRRTSRVVQTTSNAWQGVNSAGVTAAWVNEATTAADMSPTVGQIQVFPQKGVAWVLGSYEALDDTSFGEQLPGLLADARDRLESAAFATGSGTLQPLGVVAALGTGSRVAPTATGTAFVGTAAIPDVYNLQAALPPRFRNSSGAAFMGNIITLNKVRALDQYGGGAFWANLTSNTPASLLGQPIYEASDMNATMTGTSGASGTASATLLFGDFNQFIIADRVGVSMLYEPMVKGSANAQLPTGQAGWYMFWRTSSTVSTTAAFRYLTIS